MSMFNPSCLYSVELFCIRCYPNKDVYPWWNDSYTDVDTVLVKRVGSEHMFTCWVRDVPRSAEGKVMRGQLFFEFSGKGIFVCQDIVEPMAQELHIDK